MADPLNLKRTLRERMAQVDEPAPAAAPAPAAPRTMTQYEFGKAASPEERRAQMLQKEALIRRLRGPQ